MGWWSRWGYVAMLVVALWPVMGYGQSSTSFTFHSGATSVVNGNVMSAANFSTIVVQVEGVGGAFVGTVQFEKKTKDAAGYVAVQCTNANDRSVVSTTTSEAGYWECPGGAYSFRVPVTARTSGTIKVTGTGTTAVASRGAGGGGGSGSSGWPGSTQDKDINNADGLVNAIGILGASGDGTLLHTDPTDGPQIVQKCGGVVNGCDYYRRLNAGKKGGYKDASGNIDFEYTETTGKISALTVDCEDAGVNCTLYQKLPGCGGELVAVTATGAADHIWTKAVGATVPTATAEVGANSTRGVATFPDLDGDYGYEFGCLLHAGWSGQLDAKLIVDSTGSGNFVAQLFTKCYANNAAKDAAWNAVSAHTFTLGTANQPNIYTAANVTATGCAAGNIFRGKFLRNRTHANDTASAAIKVERFEFWGRTTY